MSWLSQSTVSLCLWNFSLFNRRQCEYFYVMYSNRIFWVKYSVVFLRNKIFYFSITRWWWWWLLLVLAVHRSKTAVFLFSGMCRHKKFEAKKPCTGAQITVLIYLFVCFASCLVCMAEISLNSLPSKYSILSCIHAKTWWEQGWVGTLQAWHCSVSISPKTA